MNARTFRVTAPDGTELTFTALADGRVKIESGAVGPTVHDNAEGMLDAIQGMLGGKVERTAAADHEHSHHTHDHHHSH